MNNHAIAPPANKRLGNYIAPRTPTADAPHEVTTRESQQDLPNAIVVAPRRSSGLPQIIFGSLRRDQGVPPTFERASSALVVPLGRGRRKRKKTPKYATDSEKQLDDSRSGDVDGENNDNVKVKVKRVRKQTSALTGAGSTAGSAKIKVLEHQTDACILADQKAVADREQLATLAGQFQAMPVVRIVQNQVTNATNTSNDTPLDAHVLTAASAIPPRVSWIPEPIRMTGMASQQSQDMIIPTPYIDPMVAYQPRFGKANLEAPWQYKQRLAQAEAEPAAEWRVKTLPEYQARVEYATRLNLGPQYIEESTEGWRRAQGPQFRQQMQANAAIHDNMWFPGTSSSMQPQEMTQSFATMQTTDWSHEVPPPPRADPYTVRQGVSSNIWPPTQQFTQQWGSFDGQPREQAFMGIHPYAVEDRQYPRDRYPIDQTADQGIQQNGYSPAVATPDVRVRLGNPSYAERWANTQPL
ncbi:uncharacterized protein RCC_00477 [Ramularia collo-cygni]|uniref:Uncharacterized protein n=1 Tax=Ramularia collo-cygni TaxID=112498 RepID=A0A2D3UZ71_9PEZI|nr:uncharacterized protein RCC_00477 [Ramularia collo-cygni]CZT14499.1 uncharacterized protein RCC_00477 [Ramularia collo-cygni]